MPRSSFPDEIHGQYQKYEPHEVVPFQHFVFEQYQGEYGEHQQGDHFLYYLELHEGKRAAVFAVAEAVGRHHEAIFHKCNQPTDQDQAEQTGFLKKFQVLELQMAVPGKSHKNVGQQQQDNGIKAFHEIRES